MRARSAVRRGLLLGMLALIGLVVGCATGSAPPVDPAPKVSAPEPPSPVVVEIGADKLTLAELDLLAAPDIRKAELAHARKLEDVRREAARKFIETKLLEAEAARLGLSGPEELLNREVYSKLEPPTEEDAQAFYEQNSGQIQGSFEEVRGQIFEFLLSETAEDAADTYIATLWDKADARLEVPAVRTPVEAVGPSFGPKDAKVTVVEFSDFQCPYCQAAGPVLARLRTAYGDRVRFVFRDFPLDFHERAVPAAIAAHCADDQGKFWEMHDLLFANQEALDDASLRAYADQIEGLDPTPYHACLEKADRTKVDASLAAADKVGVEGTPAFFVNGILVSGVLPYEEFAAIIEAELAR